MSKQQLDENVFNIKKNLYSNALKNSGQKQNLNIMSSLKHNKEENNRGRKIIWFNPSYKWNMVFDKKFS